MVFGGELLAMNHLEKRRHAREGIPGRSRRSSQCSGGSTDSDERSSHPTEMGSVEPDDTDSQEREASSRASDTTDSGGRDRTVLEELRDIAQRERAILADTAATIAKETAQALNPHPEDEEDQRAEDGGGVLGAATRALSRAGERAAHAVESAATSAKENAIPEDRREEIEAYCNQEAHRGPAVTAKFKAINTAARVKETALRLAEVAGLKEMPTEVMLHYLPQALADDAKEGLARTAELIGVKEKPKSVLVKEALISAKETVCKKVGVRLDRHSPTKKSTDKAGFQLHTAFDGDGTVWVGVLIVLAVLLAVLTGLSASG